MPPRDEQPRASGVSRRAALRRLAAAAGAAAFGTRIARAQSVAAPVGDSAQLGDLGMTLSPEQRTAGAAFLDRHASVDTPTSNRQPPVLATSIDIAVPRYLS